MNTKINYSVYIKLVTQHKTNNKMDTYRLRNLDNGCKDLNKIIFNLNNKLIFIIKK